MTRPSVSRTRRLRYLLSDLWAAATTDTGTVYIVSFPKCGVTWLKYMLSLYLGRSHGLGDDGPTVKLGELTRRLADVPLILSEHDGGAIVFENGVRPDPYFIFGHRRRLRYRRHEVLLLVRDPRDVVVSHFHQVTRRSARPFRFASLSEFVRHPVYGFERVLEFYDVWHRNLETPAGLLLVRYEDLRERGVGELRKILEFCGVAEPRDDLVREVYESSGFERLRALERAERVDGMRGFGADRNALKVRRGVVGGYRDELSAEDVAYCDERMRSRLSEVYGYRPNVSGP